MEKVNFDEVRRNAALQGIDVTQIIILYSNLTDAQVHGLRLSGLLNHHSGQNVSGRFAKDGDVLYPEMATGVLYLGAD